MALTPHLIEWLNSHPELRPRYSMKRRNEHHDYTSRCIYMITLVVEGRQPLLGSLCDKDINHTIPWVNITPLGKERDLQPAKRNSKPHSKREKVMSK
ncbi:MAG: hypothetical protein IKW83_06820 [Muribaculaceae bacterium]|nr:hypothetical protein [Muribaculaceae bacterium]